MAASPAEPSTYVLDRPDSQLEDVVRLVWPSRAGWRRAGGARQAVWNRGREYGESARKINAHSLLSPPFAPFPPIRFQLFLPLPTHFFQSHQPLILSTFCLTLLVYSIPPPDIPTQFLSPSLPFPPSLSPLLYLSPCSPLASPSPLESKGRRVRPSE